MGIGNPVHLMFVAAVALIVLGPKRLPDLVRSLGNGIREFRESLNGAASDDPARPEPVDPVQQLPSGDAPDRRPL
jgi:sec-independent protein translocase protein TatA